MLPLMHTDPVFALAAPPRLHLAADTGSTSASRGGSGGLAESMLDPSIPPRGALPKAARGTALARTSECRRSAVDPGSYI